jgi:hypothetical protein
VPIQNHQRHKPIRFSRVFGIKQSEEILGYNNGKTQEEYGPPIAGELLESIDFPHEKTRMVCE